MKRRNMHAWLFAFTDLSFLLLISLSLIPSAPPGISLHFAEMDPPAVPASDTLDPVEERAAAWELQVLAANDDHAAPFRLVRIDPRSGVEAEEVPLDRETLLPALERLRRENVRPVLLPEKTSFSHDFLFAAGSLARVWADGRTPTIVRPTETGGGG